MTSNQAIINPIKTRNAPDLGPVAVMAATKADLNLLIKALGLTDADCRRIYSSRLYTTEAAGQPLTVVGPMMGAPYATAILESLVAWGALKILFLGWCGGIADHLSHGDLILPSAAISAEGTSRHYPVSFGEDRTTVPSGTLFRILEKTLNCADIPHHSGTIWTTDAVFRETREQIIKLKAQGVLAVEMELSALFTVARFRDIDLAGCLIVSDDLSTLNWRPGFRTEAFRQGRAAAIEGTLALCRELRVNKRGNPPAG